MGGACGTNWAEEKSIQISMRKTEGKSRRGRPRRSLGCSNKIYLKIKWHKVVWTNLAQEWDNWPAVVSTVMNLRVIRIATNFLTDL